MITAIRKQFKSPYYRLFWMFVAGSFAAGLVTPLLYMRQGSGGPWAIRVNGKEISYSEFMRETRQQEYRLSSVRSQYGKYADMIMASLGLSGDPRATAYDALVDSELLDQASKDAGIYLHEDYVSQQMHDQSALQGVLSTVVPAYIFGQDGSIDQHLLREHLRNQGITAAQFENAIEQALNKKALAELVGLSVYVSDNDLQEKMIAAHGRKKFLVAKASLDDIRKKEQKKDVSDRELKEFFDKESKSNDAYWVPEKRDGTVWKLSSERYDRAISDDAVDAYYEAKKGTEFLKEPAMIEARKILLEVSTSEQDETVAEVVRNLRAQLMEAPSRFAAVAKEQSQDAASASRGGLIDPLTRTSTSQERELIKAAFLLKEDEAISAPIRTSRGYEIVQRISRSNPVYTSRSKAEKGIREKLSRQEFRQEFSEDLGRIVRRQRDGENIDQALRDLMQSRGASPESVSGISRDGTKQADHLFKLDEGDISFYMDGSDGFVVMLSSIERRHIAPLDRVRDVVRNDLYTHRAKKKMAILLDEGQRVLLADDEDGQIKDNKAFSMEVVDWVAVEDEKRAEQLRDKGFPFEEMMSMSKAGLVMIHTDEDAGYLIKTTDIQLPDEGFSADQKEKVRSELLVQRANGMIEAFVASLRRHATIENHESIAISR